MVREIDAAVEAAKAAGKILMDNFNKKHDIRMKSMHDFVTEADMQANSKILSILKKHFPDYKILSEETGSSGESELMWIVDPLDGTTNYSCKVPFFDVSISLAKGNDILLAITYAPFTNEMFSAEKGKGAFLNDIKIKISKINSVKNSLLIYCHGSDDKSIKRAISIFSNLKPLSRDINRPKSAQTELAFVAAGRFDAFISPGTNTWDIAGGALLVREAGGRVTDFSGQEWDIRKKDILASNGRVHDEILELIKGI